MSDTLEKIKDVTETVVDVVTDKDLQKMILGTYSDGKVRSIPDAFIGEILSPKQKKDAVKKDKKKKKKNKKKKKLKFVL